VSAPHQTSGTTYVVTFVGLIVLATLSLFLSFLHWPAGDLVISLGIAVVKALGVLWFFMHLAEQRFTYRFTVLISVLFVALLMGLTVVDVATRHTFPAAPQPTAAEKFYRR
jgi:cytochrome c oxidase subunit 4